MYTNHSISKQTNKCIIKKAHALMVIENNNVR